MKNVNLQEYFSKEELKTLLQKSDWKASYLVLSNWLLIALGFVLAAYFPNVWVILFVVILFGSRQLACAIIMHDASHHALFRSRKMNEWVGNWLGAYPIFNDMARYRPYHLKHHTNTGTHKDPDISLVKGYPTTPKSFFRKVFRDLSGQTGFKTQVGIFLMNFGYIKYSTSGLVEKISQKGRKVGETLRMGFSYYWQPLLFNFLLLGLLAALGQAWLYLLWIGALLTTYNLVLRIRAIAEHSVVPDQLDEQRNTRTTKANWLEKFFLAPNNVHYHAEHHLLMTVPPYNLPKMHRMLQERGFYERGILAQSYADVLKLAVRKRLQVSE